jgi:hypothetical protein
MQSSLKTETTNSTIDLIPELQSLADQFEAIRGDAENLLRGMSDAQFNWRAEPGRWSIGQCLDHLNVTADNYQPVIEGRIIEGRSQGKLGQGPFRHGRLGNWFVKLLEPPVKTKFKAPEMFVPPPDRSMNEVATKFFTAQENFFNLICEANGLDLARIKVQSPASKLIRLSLGQALASMTAHERRHLWQARQVKNHADFPRS